jgi:predicted RNase H-like HicB family nuclease
MQKNIGLVEKVYIGVIHKDTDSDYGISFPDFPGCITAGSNLREVKEMAMEVLPMHMNGILNDGGDIPEPTPKNKIENDPKYDDAISFMSIVVDVLE